MKKLFLPPLLALAACGSESTTTTAKPCAAVSESSTLMVGNQMRHYIAVPHFDAKSKDCWQKLRAFSKSDEAPMGLSGGAHLLVFVDSSELKAPEGGNFSEADRNRVIAQELFNKEAGVDEFTPDPSGSGRYQEPQ